MLDLAKKSVGMLAILTLITGVAYPLAVTAIAQAAFPHEANGSLIVENGKLLGSELLGQSYEDPKYFWGRLSATTPNPYNAGASAGSNLGPRSEQLIENAKSRIDALHAADPENRAPIPVDLVTSSASGLDPHISPEAAAYQAHRVAKARGLPDDRVRALVARFTEGRALGVLGEPHVRLVPLNLALDHETR